MSELHPATIHKLMSAPVLDRRDKVLGVIQICHKGFDLVSAGPDFTLDDLQQLELAAKAMSKCRVHARGSVTPFIQIRNPLNESPGGIHRWTADRRCAPSFVRPAGSLQLCLIGKNFGSSGKNLNQRALFLSASRDRSPVFRLEVSARTPPLGSSPSGSGPMATRTSRSTSTPSAASIRRIWRFLPSSRTISSQVLRSPPRRMRTCLDTQELAVFCPDARVRVIPAMPRRRPGQSARDRSCPGAMPAPALAPPTRNHWSTAAGLRWPYPADPPAPPRASAESRNA